MEIGQQISLWTIRLAVIAWFGFTIYRVEVAKTESNLKHNSKIKIARLLWTIATSLYLLHVIITFAFYHNWSHLAATQHTAKITEEAIGINWGGGIWFNHFFTIVCSVELFL